jgi:hypothetical protein
MKSGDVDFLSRQRNAFEHAIAQTLLLARLRQFPICSALECKKFREQIRPDLSDLTANKRWRSYRVDADIVGLGPCARTASRIELDRLSPVQGFDATNRSGQNGVSQHT